MTNTPAHNASPIQPPQLQWRDDGQPVASQFDDPYFSVEDGLAESRHVFLQQNGLPERWQGWQGPFCILETGFGTGLNFVMTCQAFRESAPDDCWLHFTSIEKYPLSLEQLDRAAALWPELADWYSQLRSQYPDAIPGHHCLSWPEQRIQLTLVFADIHEALPELQGPVHAWYLDGFAPSRNPDMWQPELYQQIRRLACGHPDADCTLATFTAAGAVRRGLKGAGFEVNKVPGFGRKREMLSARYQRTLGPERPPRFRTPWALPPNQHQRPRKVLVIGAGLAGCTTARALAERGMSVTLVDREAIAAGASGNPQGGLYIKLAAQQQADHNRFYLAALLTSLRWMQRLSAEADAPFWKPCGVLQLGWSLAEEQRQQRFLEQNQLPASLIEAMTESQLQQTGNSAQSGSALAFPAAGWVKPALFCEHLASHSGINFEQRRIHTLLEQEHGWAALTEDGQTLLADQVVVANASAAKTLLPDTYLPVKSIRGQLTYLNPDLTPPLNQVLCARAYMAPPQDGRLVLGATYNLRDQDTDLRQDDHRENLGHLEDFGPQWAKLGTKALTDTSAFGKLVLGGRVGFRCATPDYLPMVGAIVDTESFVDRYRPMVKNAKHIPAVLPPVRPGLWLNIGHGSRGLASTPLCAELLAARITGNAAPLAHSTEMALLPARFLLRDMIRNKLDRRNVSG